MANDLVFTEEEMAVDACLGYPKAFGKLCRERSFGPYSHGPPYTFNPYALVQQEEARSKELDEMFPLIDPKAKPTTKPKIFSSLLWKQLNHLGNAGFDPEIIRVDPYGNVLYYHADAASPLAWEIDHVFPCSRGGLTVPSNLRILQWQICRRKHNKLEFLIPWWDLQLGISINQFLSIFASSNSDFRRRAFSWLFSEGENEELIASQTVDSHTFPQKFLESEDQLGLAPAAIVRTRRDPFDAPLKSLDLNRRPRSNTPIVAAVKKGKLLSTETENALIVTNPYQAIVMARDSLKQREEAAKMQAEIHKLDNEVCELEQKTEEDKLSIQELELVLIKKRRRAEKCRWLAESQSSYRTMLEKMIRDALHQSVVYKEQVRLNQAAASALLARLEAQKAICDSAERELHIKFQHRDELEKQIRPEWEQARKRSRMDDNTLTEEGDGKITLCLPQNEPKMQEEMEENDTLCSEENDSLAETNSAAHSEKELRKFLEEEPIASAASLLQNEELEEEELDGENETNLDKTRAVTAKDDESIVEERLEKMNDGGKIYKIHFPFPHEHEEEEDEESRKQRGRGNIEKWMQILLQNTLKEEDEETRKQLGKQCIEKWMQFLLENKNGDAGITPQISDEKEASKTDELIEKMDKIYPHIEVKDTRSQNPDSKEIAEVVEEKIEGQSVVSDKRDKNTEGSAEMKPISDGDIESDKSVANITTSSKKAPYKKGKGGRTNSIDEKGLVRSDSARALRRIPSSPSLLLEGMKKRVDCIGRRKPMVLDDNDGDEKKIAAKKSFIKSFFKHSRKQ